MVNHLENRLAGGIKRKTNSFLGADVEIKLQLEVNDEEKYTEISFLDQLKKVNKLPVEIESDSKSTSSENDEKNKVVKKKKKLKDSLANFSQLGYGYDDTDDFIDDTEAFEEYIPDHLETTFGGFYVNQGPLKFVKSESLEQESPQDAPIAPAKKDVKSNNDKKSKKVKPKIVEQLPKESKPSPRKNETKKNKVSKEPSTQNSTIIEAGPKCEPTQALSQNSVDVSLSQKLPNSQTSHSNSFPPCPLSDEISTEILDIIKKIGTFGKITKKDLTSNMEVRNVFTELCAHFKDLTESIKMNIAGYLSWKLKKHVRTLTKYLQQLQLEVLINNIESLSLQIKQVVDEIATSLYQKTCETSPELPQLLRLVFDDFKPRIKNIAELFIKECKLTYTVLGIKRDFRDVYLADIVAKKIITIFDGYAIPPREVHIFFYLLATDIYSSFYKKPPFQPKMVSVALKELPTNGTPTNNNSIVSSPHKNHLPANNSQKNNSIIRNHAPELLYFGHGTPVAADALPKYVIHPNFINPVTTYTESQLMHWPSRQSNDASSEDLNSGGPNRMQYNQNVNSNIPNPSFHQYNGFNNQMPELDLKKMQPNHGVYQNFTNPNPCINYPGNFYTITMDPRMPGQPYNCVTEASSLPSPSAPNYKLTLNETMPIATSKS